MKRSDHTTPGRSNEKMPHAPGCAGRIQPEDYVLLLILLLTLCAMILHP